MPDRFLPDYGLYLMDKGGRPETRLMFSEWSVEHLTRPDLRTVSLTLSTEEGDQEYALSFDFTGPRVEELLAAFPEPPQEAIWRWLEDRYTVGEPLALSPPAPVFSIEATLGAVQQGLFERFAPLIVRRVATRPRV